MYVFYSLRWPVLIILGLLYTQPFNIRDMHAFSYVCSVFRFIVLKMDCWKFIDNNILQRMRYTNFRIFFFRRSLCVPWNGPFLCLCYWLWCIISGCKAQTMCKWKPKKEPTTTESLRVFFSDALAKNAQLGNNHQKQNRLPLKTKTKKIECCIFPLNCVTVRFYRH